MLVYKLDDIKNWIITEKQIQDKTTKALKWGHDVENQLDTYIGIPAAAALYTT